MNLVDFKEDYDDHERAEKIKRYARQKKEYEAHKVASKHGKKSKTYKDFMSGKKTETKSSTKGVRAVHQGRWGYMKDRKFTPDKSAAKG